MHAIELQIAAGPVRDALPETGTLTERLLFAMRYVRKHKDDLFWMSPSNDDTQFRTALAAVMLKGDAEDNAVIERSMLPIRALTAALNGIPVDFTGLVKEGTLPLMKLWQDSAQPEV